MNAFQIRGTEIELYKLLKASGLAESGGQAKLAISEGQVKVNGSVETRKAFKVRPGDKIDYEGQSLVIQPEN